MFGINFGAKKREEPKGEYLTARLNVRIQPIDRGEYFEDPLDESIVNAGLGKVTGGGTQLAEEPAGIEYCDLEILAYETSDATLTAIVKRLEELGAPKGSKLILDNDGREIPFGVEEGLAVYLNGADLPENVYATGDVNHVIEELDRLMGEAGKFRGFWEGSRETGLYCYGPDFVAMRAAIEPLLSSYPLCEKARVEQIA